MATNYPIWATEKQLEGMHRFASIAKEYGNFEVKFKQNNWESENESIFIAVVTWGRVGANEKGIREHAFRCGWDYEETWNHCGERVRQWQFVFAGGDAVLEMTAEAFFLDLFFYLDGIAETRREQPT